MDGNVTDFHLLTSIGAACLALSFIRGMAGFLRHSIWMAALAALMGMVAAIDGGALNRPGHEAVFVIMSNVVLPLLAVLVSRKFYLTGRRME